MALTSKDGFAASEKQARTTLSIFRHYFNGPKLQSDTELSQQEVAVAVCCVIASIAYYFTAQAEAYLAMSNLHKLFGNDGWRTGVFAILGAGLFSSFLLSELIPYTRLITQSHPVAEPERMETLVGQVLGINSRTSNQRNWLAFITIGFVTVILLFIIYAAIQGNLKTGNWLAIILAPLLFCLDTLFGVGPFWLLVFCILRCRMYYGNWRANRNYTRLEEAWNLVPELYSGAQDWYFQEHPEINRRPEMLPPVSPLCAFIITHPCHEGIEIPAAIINPEGNTGDDTGAAPVPEEAPDVTPRNPSSGNGAPKAEPSKTVDEKEATKAPDKDKAIDNPADLFAAMDSDSDANDVTF